MFSKTLHFINIAYEKVKHIKKENIFIVVVIFFQNSKKVEAWAVVLISDR